VDSQYNSARLSTVEQVGNPAAFGFQPDSSAPVEVNRIEQGRDIQPAKGDPRSPFVDNWPGGFEQYSEAMMTLLLWHPDRSQSVGVDWQG